MIQLLTLKEVPHPDMERLQAFENVRDAVHQDMHRRLQRRLKAGKWQYTAMEAQLGAYQQEIEPQVWNAVKVMNRKGYKTGSSGFAGEYGERQQIDGTFFIDSMTKDTLKTMGVYVLPYPDWYIPGEMIIFYPKQPDFPRITQVWNQVAHLLPDLTKPRRNKA